MTGLDREVQALRRIANQAARDTPIQAGAFDPRPGLSTRRRSVSRIDAYMRLPWWFYITAGFAFGRMVALLQGWFL